MSRFLFFTVLLACVFYVLQAVPVPDDPQQAATNDLDLAAEARKVLDGAKELLSNVNLNEALESAKTYLGQAGENIRTEIEKMAEKVQG